MLDYQPLTERRPKKLSIQSAKYTYKMKECILPLSPGRVERHGFEYYRNGTFSLYAALNTKPARC
jgi:hypothetical protein